MRKLLRFVGCAAVLSLASAARADINGFGNFQGFTINQADPESAPGLTVGKIHITDSATNDSEDRSIFFNTPQSVSNFTATFTYQDFNLRANTAISSDSGACFVIENSPQGVNAIGTNANDNLDFGYGGGDPLVSGNPLMSPSIAISLELNSPTLTGLYTNGNLGTGVSTSPVNLYSGDPIYVTLRYDGSNLYETLLDTTTNMQFGPIFYQENLPNRFPGSAAYIGFTAGNFYGTDQYISNFSYVTGVPEPAALSLLAVAIPASLARRRSKAI